MLTNLRAVLESEKCRTVWSYDASSRISRGTTFIAIICIHSKISTFFADADKAEELGHLLE